MLRLPHSTEINRPIPKAQLYKKFELKQAQRDAFDADVARIIFALRHGYKVLLAVYRTKQPRRKHELFNQLQSIVGTWRAMSANDTMCAMSANDTFNENLTI